MTPPPADLPYGPPPDGGTATDGQFPTEVDSDEFPFDDELPDYAREPPPDESLPPPPGWLPPADGFPPAGRLPQSDELPPSDWPTPSDAVPPPGDRSSPRSGTPQQQTRSRQHPWAGVSPARQAEWKAHRAAKTAARPSARARAQAAFEAFFAAAGDGATCDRVADDSEAAFEFALLVERWIRGLTGLKHRVLAVFASARSAEPDPAKIAGQSGRQPEDYLGDEVALAFGLAPAAGHALLSAAIELTDRLPTTLAAMEAGTLDLPRAHVLLDVTSTLTDRQTRTVEDTVLGRGPRPSRAAFRRAARTAADRANPQAAADRAARRRDQRSAWKGHDHDGVASIGASLPAEVAQGIWQRLTTLARLALVPDDTRNLDQARADVFASLLLGRNTGDLGRSEGKTVPVEIQVLVPVTTLAGMDDHPAHLVGHGPIPAELARTLAEHAHWRRILYDPADGTPLESANRRHATKALRNHVQVRDQYCQHPGCPRLATECDTDHTRPHHTGGLTVHSNLGAACRRHHRMKDEDNGWDVSQPTPGVFLTTTPTGRAYTNQPDRPWADHDRPTAATGADPWKSPATGQPNF